MSFLNKKSNSLYRTSLDADYKTILILNKNYQQYCSDSARCKKSLHLHTSLAKRKFRAIITFINHTRFGILRLNLIQPEIKIFNFNLNPGIFWSKIIKYL